MQSWGLTDPGCVRKQNQDAYRIEQLDRETLVGVVCDGMGGAKSGNVASSLAVEVFTGEVRRTQRSGMTPDVVLTEVEQAQAALGELTGRTAREDMVARIFERFCVGK